MTLTAALLNRPAVLVQRAYVDDDSGEGAYVDTETAVLIYWEQLGTDEESEGAPAREIYRAVFDLGVDLTSAAAIKVDGRTFELDGEPWVVWNPRLAAPSHVEVRARWAG